MLLAHVLGFRGFPPGESDRHLRTLGALDMCRPRRDHAGVPAVPESRQAAFRVSEAEARLADQDHARSRRSGARRHPYRLARDLLDYFPQPQSRQVVLAPDSGGHGERGALHGPSQRGIAGRAARDSGAPRKLSRRRIVTASGERVPCPAGPVAGRQRHLSRSGSSPRRQRAD